MIHLRLRSILPIASIVLMTACSGSSPDNGSGGGNGGGEQATVEPFRPGARLKSRVEQTQSEAWRRLAAILQRVAPMPLAGT